MKEDKDFIKGLAGFIKWAYDNHKDAEWILSNLTHNICEYAREEPGFSPRTRSYAKYWLG